MKKTKNNQKINNKRSIIISLEKGERGDVKGPLLQKKGERSETKQFLKTPDKKQHEERKQRKRDQEEGAG